MSHKLNNEPMKNSLTESEIINLVPGTKIYRAGMIGGLRPYIEEITIYYSFSLLEPKMHYRYICISAIENLTEIGIDFSADFYYANDLSGHSNQFGSFLIKEDAERWLADYLDAVVKNPLYVLDKQLEEEIEYIHDRDVEEDY